MKLGQKVKYYDRPYVYDATIIDVRPLTKEINLYRIRYVTAWGERKEEEVTPSGWLFTDLKKIIRCIESDINDLENTKAQIEKELLQQEDEAIPIQSLETAQCVS